MTIRQAEKEKEGSDLQMSDKELRTALSCILLNQSIILRLTRRLTKKKYEKMILDYAQDLVDYSKA